jgi:plasmid maintenance system antidote protein VapI
MEIKEQLGAYKDRALLTNTRLAQLIRGPQPNLNDVQAHPSLVSTLVVQRTIRELVSKLTSEIIIILEDLTCTQMEFHTKLQSRLEGVLATVEIHFSDYARLNAAKAVH